MECVFVEVDRQSVSFFHLIDSTLIRHFVVSLSLRWVLTTGHVPTMMTFNDDDW